MAKKIKIIGDVMLDEWIEGRIQKKSAEAPIKIFETKKIKTSLGGAGNLCLNMKSLGINFKLFSEVGNDLIGLKIIDNLNKKKIDHKILIEKKNSTLKKRYFDGNKQIFREDVENTNVNKLINKKISKFINKNDLVVISDYKKGFINKNLHRELIKKKCLTFIDPKNNPEFYKQAFLVKPNMEKFEEWCGKFTKRKAFSLMRSMKWNWLIISNNKLGVHVFNRNGKYNFYKVKSYKDPNVIGAGDIFFSGIIYNYLKGFDVFTAVELSSYAASICVSKKKIRVIRFSDFKKNIVFTNGVFDIFHKGHKDLLLFAKKIGKKVILGINSDRSVRLNKGPKRPVNNLSTRIRNLKKRKIVDKIISFDQKTPLNLIRNINPDVIIKGDDYDFSEIAGANYFNVILFKKKNNFSSSKIIDKLK